MATELNPAAAFEEEDAEVIRQVLHGNTAMFELLMRRYNERVYRAARAIVRDEQEAEDVMQQTYVNAFTHLRQFNGSSQFSTWLTRIAINEALARVRRQGRYEVFDDELSGIEPFASRNPSENPERQAFTSGAARAARVGHRHPPGRRARSVRASRGRRSQHGRRGGVPRSDRGCRQDPPVARSRRVEASPPRANRRDSNGRLSVLPSPLRPSRRASAQPDSLAVTFRRLATLIPEGPVTRDGLR